MSLSNLLETCPALSTYHWSLKYLSHLDLSSPNRPSNNNSPGICVLSVSFHTWLISMRQTWLPKMFPCVTPWGHFCATPMSSSTHLPVCLSQMVNMDSVWNRYFSGLVQVLIKIEVRCETIHIKPFLNLKYSTFTSFYITTNLWFIFGWMLINSYTICPFDIMITSSSSSVYRYNPGMYMRYMSPILCASMDYVIMIVGISYSWLPQWGPFEKISNEIPCVNSFPLFLITLNFELQI